MQRNFIKKVAPLIVFTFLMATLATTALCQDSPCSITWDSIQQISYDTIYSFVPQIIATNDTIHLIWFNSHPSGGPDSSYGIFYSRSTDDGTTFSWPRQLIPGASPQSTIGTGNIGQLAVWHNYVYLLYDATRYDLYNGYSSWLSLRRSTDGGATWDSVREINQTAPVNIATQDSNVYLFFLDSDSLNGHLRIFGGCLISHDYGQNFSLGGTFLPVDAAYGGLSAASNNLNYVFCRNFPLGYSGYLEVMQVGSSDGGVSWSAPVNLSTNDSIASLVPTLAETGSDVYVAYEDYKYGITGDSHGSIILRRSTDSGRTFEPERILSYLPTGSWPRISALRRSVALVWNDFVDFYTDRSVLRMSFDRGNSWHDTVVVNSNGGDACVSMNDHHVFVAWWRDRDIFLRRGTFAPGCFPPRIPTHFALWQNYPNPFNGSTTISYDLPSEAYGLRLSIYNMLGQEIARLFEVDHQVPGSYELRWSPAGQPSGIYFYQLRSNRFNETRKLVLVR